MREAFRARGHDAWSCDLLPAEDGSAFHMQCDVLEVSTYGSCWDLMIAHPPCTYLANSGVRWLHSDPSRWRKMLEAASFFKALLDQPIKRICIENPIPHGLWNPDKYTQIIQPWQFGHGETKATCLWLKGLPKLEPTRVVKGRKGRIHAMSPGPERWKERSRTYPGIARAMARQWG